VQYNRKYKEPVALSKPLMLIFSNHPPMNYFKDTNWNTFEARFNWMELKQSLNPSLFASFFFKGVPRRTKWAWVYRQYLVVGIEV